MRCDELAVEQREPTTAETRDKVCERNFTGIRRTAKHTLTKKCAPKSDAVKTANERARLPNLNRMRVATRVKCTDRVTNNRVDPGLLAVGTALQHRIKCAVYTGGEAA